MRVRQNRAKQTEASGEKSKQSDENRAGFGVRGNETDVFLIRMRYQFWLAVTVFVIFFVILITTIVLHQNNPQNVISIAGIFSAWMGAIIAFYYMEHRTSETVFSVKRSEEEIRNRLDLEQREASGINDRLTEIIESTHQLVDKNKKLEQIIDTLKSDNDDLASEVEDKEGVVGEVIEE